MNRVATRGNYQSALMNLMQSQKRGQIAQQQFSSGKLGTNHAEFGRVSEAITAMKTSQTRISGFLATAKTTADRLSSQDLALERIATSATDARNAIANAIAAGRTEGMMTEIRSLFQAVQDGINTRHQGKYLFSGGAVDTRPSDVTFDNLPTTDLTTVFKNDDLIQTSWVDENITLKTGFLAENLGQDLYGLFKTMAELEATNEANGTPLNGLMTEDQREALEDLIELFDKAASAIVTEQATNGAIQSRTDSIIETHVARADTLEVMLADKTDVDMAKAVTELELSQLAIQASAQVISQLRQTSLLDYLR